MRPGTHTGATEYSEALALPNRITNADIYASHVRIHRPYTKTVFEHDEVTKTELLPPGLDHRTVRGCDEAESRPRVSDIKAGMPVPPPEEGMNIRPPLVSDYAEPAGNGPVRRDVLQKLALVRNGERGLSNGFTGTREHRGESAQNIYIRFERSSRLDRGQ